MTYWVLPDEIGGGKLCKIRPRNLFLIIISYLFYANWNPSYTLILLYITLLTYYGAKYFEGNNSKQRKHVISLTAIAVLMPLLVFKYYNFLNESIWVLLQSLGVRFELRGLNWAIPIGISFYTFQALGYLFDVYYKRISAEHSFEDYVLFVCFFPQIFSGPISKADELLPQIKKKRCFDYEQGVQGLKFILWGTFLKLVLADRLGLYVDKVVMDYEMYNGGTCALSAVFYSIQIYGDFAGYSLMAIGVAKTLGFDLTDNFRRPYLATSITDFWKRWHISLTRWLTQQVYIPMGGSRCSKVRNYWNILVTFLVSGIWHGANWTFIVWGLIHGFAQILEKEYYETPANNRDFCNSDSRMDFLQDAFHFRRNNLHRAFNYGHQCSKDFVYDQFHYICDSHRVGTIKGNERGILSGKFALLEKQLCEMGRICGTVLSDIIMWSIR